MNKMALGGLINVYLNRGNICHFEIKGILHHLIKTGTENTRYESSVDTTGFT